MAENTGLSFGAVMVYIHMAISRGLYVAIEGGSRFEDEGYRDAATHAGFVLYVQTLIAVLRGHHMSEDAVAFPRLRDRLPDVPFDKLMADHRLMDSLLDEFEQGTGAMRGESEPGLSLTELIQTATALSDLWHPHIRIEEAMIYAPEIGAMVMNADEDAELSRSIGAYAQEHVQPLSLSMPFLIFNLPRQERGRYTAAMPPMLTEQLVPVVWKDEWAPMQPFLLD